MRRTRISRNKAMSGIVTFLILAIVFVGSGYLIGKFLLSSLLQRQPAGEPVSGDKTQPPPSGASTVSVQISTKPLTLYRVQLGAFSSRENADKTAALAIQQGVPAGVMSPDPLHKVYCGVTGSKEAAMKLSESALPKLSGIVGKDDNLYVATMDVTAYDFSITGAKEMVEELQGAFATLDNAMASLIGFWDAYYLGQAIQVNLASMEQDITAVKDDLAKLTADSGAKTAHEVALQIATDMEEAIKEARKVQGGDGASITSGMTALINLVDEYVQSLKGL
ncbi:MAG: SPOR domain-containing protein [Bacillota bacterium]